MCRQYEAAMPSAGRMLSNRVHAALDAEFAENDLREVSQVDIEVGVIDEVCDVQKWLARFDIDQASRNELVVFQTECKQAIDAIMQAQSRAKAREIAVSMKRNGAKV